MSDNQEVIGQILEVSKKMHAFGSSGRWDLLMEADSQRAEIVTQLALMDGNRQKFSEQIEQIRALQAEIMQLVTAEKERVEKEYSQAKGKLSVSSSYLKNMESTLT